MIKHEDSLSKYQRFIQNATPTFRAKKEAHPGARAAMWPHQFRLMKAKEIFRRNERARAFFGRPPLADYPNLHHDFLSPLICVAMQQRLLLEVGVGAARRRAYYMVAAPLLAIES